MKFYRDVEDEKVAGRNQTDQKLDMSGRQKSQNRALLIISFSIHYNVTNKSENSYCSQYTLQKNKLNILILSYIYFPVLIVTKAKRKVTIIDISAVIHSAFTLRAY